MCAKVYNNKALLWFKYLSRMIRTPMRSLLESTRPMKFWKMRICVRNMTCTERTAWRRTDHQAEDSKAGISTIKILVSKFYDSCGVIFDIQNVISMCFFIQNKTLGLGRFLISLKIKNMDVKPLCIVLQ